MAVNVSPNYRQTVYNGEKLYTCHLSINNNVISSEKIQEIKISRPIIDDTQETFYIGTFISDKLEITFKNTNDLDIQSGYEIEFSVDLDVDGTEENTPFQPFIIDELGENYYKSNKITGLDYSIKFADAIEEPYQNVMAYDESTETYSISIEDLLLWLCNDRYHVELGTYPNTNKDVITGQWDSTASGKQYISWIAELMGGNAKIGRDGKLNIIPLKSASVTTIDVPSSKSFELGEKYHISHVTYFDALNNYTYPQDDTPVQNTLIIRQGNIFIPNGEDTIHNSAIENIYDDIKDFEIYSLKNENFGDLSLDPFDIVTYQNGNDTYTTYYQGEIRYAISVMANIQVKIPTKQQEVTTNVKKPKAEDSIRKLYTEVDGVKNEIIIGATKTTNIEKRLDGDAENDIPSYETFRQDTRVFIDESGTRFASSESLSNGDVSTVKTENVKLDINGINIFKTEGGDIDDNTPIISDTKSTINETGSTVYKVENGQAGDIISFNGYVSNDSTTFPEYRGQSLSYQENLVVGTFAVFGNHSRIEDFVDEDGNDAAGMFWIGD